MVRDLYLWRHPLLPANYLPYKAKTAKQAWYENAKEKPHVETGGVPATAGLAPLIYFLDRRTRARRLHGVVALALVRVHVVQCALQARLDGLEIVGGGVRILGPVDGPRVVCDVRVCAAGVVKFNFTRAALGFAHAQSQSLERAYVERGGFAPTRRTGQELFLQHALLALRLTVVPASSLDAIRIARAADARGCAPGHRPVRGRAT
jgi:hypothetical protein